MSSRDKNTMNYIPHYCTICNHTSYTETHTDPDAHFPSLSCERCDRETEGCPCEDVITERQMMARQLGSAGGTARAKNLAPDKLSQIGRSGASKRWGK